MAKIDTLSQEQIKVINRVNVINEIRKHKELTKHQIAKNLELSIPTVTANINEMIKEGYVYEAGVAESTGGRKPVILKFDENARYSIGVNIAPGHVSIIFMNLNAKIIKQMNFTYSDQLEFSKLLELLGDKIYEVIDDLNIRIKSILGIGLSLPGLVEEEKLFLDSAPNLGVKDFSFKAFQERMAIPLYIENEANVAAYAETIEGHHQNMSNVVYISVTEGVGTGIIIDNLIYKSSHKKAGEFGHMRISDESIRCNCGRTGCWELFASKRALFRFYREATGNNVTNLEDIFTETEMEKPLVKTAISKYMDYLFVGIENIILGLNPEYVIIGGELGRYKNELMDLVNEKTKLKSSYMEYEGTRIIFSDLEDKGALIGAGLLPIQTIFAYQKSVI